MTIRKTMAIAAALICGSLSIGAEEAPQMTPNQQKGYGMLCNAIEYSRKANFICEIDKPFADYPMYDKVRFCRRHDNADGFTSLRLELCTGKKCKAVFIRNHDGEFAVDGKGRFALRGIAFDILNRLEEIHNDFYENEMKYASYSISEENHRWRHCNMLRIAVSSSRKNPAEHARITGVGDANPRIMRNVHCYTHEYTIDQTTGQIYSVRYINGNGILLRTLTLGQFTAVQDWGRHTGLFDTPANILGATRSESEFFSLLKRLEIK